MLPALFWRRHDVEIAKGRERFAQRVSAHDLLFCRPGVNIITQVLTTVVQFLAPLCHCIFWKSRKPKSAADFAGDHLDLRHRHLQYRRNLSADIEGALITDPDGDGAFIAPVNVVL